MTKQEQNIEFFKKNRQDCEYIEFENLKILLFNSVVSMKKKPAMMVWKGKQQNPFSNYYYMSEERRKEALENHKKSALALKEYKEKRKAERKAFNPDVKVGDIYRSSWGYEQTNIDFYQVIEVKGKSTVVLREIAHKMKEDSMYEHGMACEVLPLENSFLNENTITKRVGKYGITLNSYASASKWDGKAEYKSWYY
jgi:hypothetical protein